MPLFAHMQKVGFLEATHIMYYRESFTSVRSDKMLLMVSVITAAAYIIDRDTHEQVEQPPTPAPQTHPPSIRSDKMLLMVSVIMAAAYIIDRDTHEQVKQPPTPAPQPTPKYTIRQDVVNGFCDHGRRLHH